MAEINLTESLVYEDKDRKDPVVVIGKQKGSKISIGVARCGINQKYNKMTGVKIASNRAEIQPYTSINAKHHKSFGIVAKSICNHITNQKQPRLQNVKTNR